MFDAVYLNAHRITTSLGAKNPDLRTQTRNSRPSDAYAALPFS